MFQSIDVQVQVDPMYCNDVPMFALTHRHPRLRATNYGPILFTTAAEGYRNNKSRSTPSLSPYMGVNDLKM